MQISTQCPANFSTKKGMSLVVVLSVMVLATVVGTSLYRTLHRQAGASGAQLHTQTALASAQAGLSATRAWMTYHGVEVRAKLMEFLQAKQANGGTPVPFELDVSARFPSNSRGQEYKAFLVDVMADASTPNTPFSVKVQILGKGQDGSETVLSAVLELGGIIWQQRPNSLTPPPSSAGGEDALFVGGNLGTLNTPLITEGSLYINSNFQTNSSGPLHVRGDLVFGPGADESYFNAALTVDGDLYVAGEFYTNNALAHIRGNAYFHTHIRYIQATTVIDGSAFFNGRVGNGGNNVGDLLHVKGHATFNCSVNINGSGHVRVDGDAGFMGRFSTIRTNNNGRITVFGNSQNWGTFDIDNNNTANFGTTAANWVDRRISLGRPLTGPATINPNGDTLTWDPNRFALLGKADTLARIRAKLNAPGAVKPEPFEVKQDTINKYSKTWAELRTMYPTCGASISDFTGTALQCFYNNAPASIKTQGFLVADLRGLNWNDDNPTPLDGKFVVLINTSNNGRFPPSTPDSRVLIYQTGGSVNFGIQNGGDCYCVFYARDGGTMNITGSGRIIGATLYGHGTSLNVNSGTGLTFVFNRDVVSGIAATGAIADANGNPPFDIGTPPPPSWEIALLSPRLHVKTLGEYPQADLIDTASVQKPAPGVVLTPNFIEVDSGAVITASTSFFQTNYGVVPRVVFAPDPSACNPGVVGSPTINTNRLFAVTRVEYRPGCGVAGERSAFLEVRVRGPSALTPGQGSISFVSATITRKYDSGPLFIPVNLEVNGALSQASQVNVVVTSNLSQSSLASSGVVLPAAGTFNVVAGQSSSFPLLSLQMDLTNQPTRLDRPEGEVRIRLEPVAGGRIKQGTIVEYVVRLEEHRFTMFTLSTTVNTAQGEIVALPSADSLPNFWRRDRQLTLTAIPREGFEFSAWGGDCTGSGGQCNLTMNSNKSVSATFVPRNFTLTILPSVGGSVNTSPTCGTPCVRQHGQTVQLSAVASVSPVLHTFTRWEGTGAFSGSTTNPVIWAATSNDTVRAIFRSTVRNCFFDDFNAASLSTDWRKFGPGPNFQLSGGNLTRPNGNTSLLIRNVDIEANGTAEARVRYIDQWNSNGDGLVLRFQDSLNYYYFLYFRGNLSDNRIQFCRVQAGTAHCSWAGANLSNPSGAIRFSVQASGATFTVRVNETVYATFTDAAFASGRTGIRMGGWNTMTEWDEFRWTEASGCGTAAPPEIANCRITNSNGVDMNNANDTLVVLQGSQLRTRATATDPEGNPMTFRINATDGSSHGPVNLVGSAIDHSALRNTLGSYTLTLLVEDNTGLSSTCLRRFRVVPPVGNQAPVIGLNSMRVGAVNFVNGTTAPATVDFRLEATDPDGDPLQFAWSGVVTPKTENGMFSTHSHNFTAGGTYAVQVTVSDGRGGSTLHTFNLVFTGSNNNPIIDSVVVNPASGTMPHAVSYRVFARDPDNDPLSYTWSGAITGTAATVNHTFTNAGSYSASVTVRDNRGGLVTMNAPVVIVNSTVNTPPVISMCTADPATGQAPRTVSFTANATDANGDPLTYTWGSPVSRVGQTVSADFTSAFNGNVAVTVSDGRGGSATCNAPLNIAAPNVAPVITNCQALEQNPFAPQRVNFSATATDANLDVLTYRWTGTGTGNFGVVNQQNHSFIFTTPGTYAVTLVVEDNKGGSATCNRSIVVPPHVLPTVSCAASPTTANVGQSVTWTATATSPNLPLSYSWSGTDALTGSAATVNRAYTSSGTKNATVVVTDVAGGSTTRVCPQITVGSCSPGQCAQNPLTPMKDSVFTATSSGVFVQFGNASHTNAQFNNSGPQFQISVEKCGVLRSMNAPDWTFQANGLGAGCGNNIWIIRLTGGSATSLRIGNTW